MKKSGSGFSTLFGILVLVITFTAFSHVVETKAAATDIANVQLNTMKSWESGDLRNTDGAATDNRRRIRLADMYSLQFDMYDITLSNEDYTLTAYFFNAGGKLVGTQEFTGETLFIKEAGFDFVRFTLKYHVREKSMSPGMFSNALGSTITISIDPVVAYEEEEADTEVIVPFEGFYSDSIGAWVSGDIDESNGQLIEHRRRIVTANVYPVYKQTLRVVLSSSDYVLRVFEYDSNMNYIGVQKAAHVSEINVSSNARFVRFALYRTYTEKSLSLGQWTNIFKNGLRLNISADMPVEENDFEIIVAEEPVAEEIIVAEEPVAEEIIVAEEPVADEVIVAEEPVAEEIIVVEEPVAEEVIVAEEPVAEEIIVVEEPVAEEVIVAEEPVAEEIIVAEEPVVEIEPEPVVEVKVINTLYDEIKDMYETGDMGVRDISKYKADFAKLYAAYREYIYGEGYLYFASSSEVYITNTNFYNGYCHTLQLGDMDPDFLNRYNRMVAALDEIKAGIDDRMSDLEKILYVYQYVCDHSTYLLKSLTCACPGGILGDGQGKCIGYAETMTLVLKELGINCYRVSSNAQNHTWNYVEIDGQLYHLDATWDNTRADSSGRGSYTYLIRSDASFAKNIPSKHTGWEVILTHVDAVGDRTASSTEYDNWFIHDVRGKLLYADGYWYYADGCKIMKSDILGNDMSIVLTETADASIISLNEGVLTYSVNGSLHSVSIY